jgi:glutamine synthetase
VDTGVIPAASKHQEALARSVAAAAAANVPVAAQRKALESYASDLNDCVSKRAALEALLAEVRKGHPEASVHARGLVDRVRPAMAALRAAADRLESQTDAALWPFPTYHQMLFM